MIRRTTLLPLLLLVAVPAVAAGQSRLFVAGLAGAGFSLNDIGPGTGGGFGAQGALGVGLRGLSLGGEVAEHRLGYDRKVRILGGFVRLSALGTGPVQPYLALGVGAYRYTPGAGGGSTSLGGSIGPGALFRLGVPRVSLLLEARLHTDLDGVAQVSTQEFLGVLGGVQVGL